MSGRGRGKTMWFGRRGAQNTLARHNTVNQIQREYQSAVAHLRSIGALTPQRLQILKQLTQQKLLNRPRAQQRLDTYGRRNMLTARLMRR